MVWIKALILYHLRYVMGSISNIYEICSQSRLNLAKIQQNTGSIRTRLKKFILNVIFQKYTKIVNTLQTGDADLRF